MHGARAVFDAVLACAAERVTACLALRPRSMPRQLIRTFANLLDIKDQVSLFPTPEAAIAFYR